MKRILSSLLLLSVAAIGFTGCLKDKGFENQTYGINDPDTQPPGVGFPRASAPNSKILVGLDAGSTTTQVINDVVYVNLESATPAPSDITITIALDDAIRTAYNTANGTNILALPPAVFTGPTLTLTIPAGQRNVQVPINILSTTTLNPSATYGLGLKIVSVTGGYVIASNLQNLLVEFNIKNKFDGKYRLVGVHNRTGFTLPYDEQVHMITTGPNSVAMYWPALGNYAHPINAGANYYTAFTTNFIFSPTANSDGSYTMVTWDQTPYATTVVPTVNPGSKWVPHSTGGGDIYADFYYNANPSQRGFIDTLYYIGPR